MVYLGHGAWFDAYSNRSIVTAPLGRKSVKHRVVTNVVHFAAASYSTGRRKDAGFPLVSVPRKQSWGPNELLAKNCHDRPGLERIGCQFEGFRGKGLIQTLNTNSRFISDFSL